MKKNPFLILARYVLLLLIVSAFYYSAEVYSIFFNITVCPVNFLLNLFYSASISGSLILINTKMIEIIPACVGISAYVLLLMLNLTIKMKLKTRLLSIFFSFIALWILNIARIFFLAVLLLNNYVYFDIIHKFLWYFMNFLFVAAIWFFTAYLFKIKSIPVYDDFISIIKFKSNKNTNKK